MVALVKSYTHATRIGWHPWESDLRFAPGLPAGWQGGVWPGGAAVLPDWACPRPGGAGVHGHGWCTETSSRQELASVAPALGGVWPGPNLMQGRSWALGIQHRDPDFLLPSEEAVLPESQGPNLAFTVSYVPCSLESGTPYVGGVNH